MAITHTLDVQLHDPAKGPFTPQWDPSFSMMTGTRPMRVGKTADDGGANGRRRELLALIRASYMYEFKPTNSREYGARVGTRYRKNLAAGLIGE